MENHLLRDLVELHRRQLAAQETTNAYLESIAANTQPLATNTFLTRRKIYKQEAISLLGISERTYNRWKAEGKLKPHGLGHDFYYPEDLQPALAESRRKGKV